MTSYGKVVWTTNLASLLDPWRTDEVYCESGKCENFQNHKVPKELHSK